MYPIRNIQLPPNVTLEVMEVEQPSSIKATSSSYYDNAEELCPNVMNSFLHCAGLTIEQMERMGTKSLNSLLKKMRIGKEDSKKIKQCRRTLKNRRYALKSRQERQRTEKELESDIERLKNQINQLKKEKDMYQEESSRTQYYSKKIRQFLSVNNCDERRIHQIKYDIIEEIKKEYDFPESYYDEIWQL